MAGQKLSEARLRKLEGQIQGVLDNMNNQVSDLERVIEMLSTQWRGVGAGQFTKAQSDINRHHRNLQKIMRQVKEAIEATRRDGGANDENVAAAMKGVDLNGSAPGDGMVSAGSYGETGGEYKQYSKLNGL
ncbi:WXG100 family type VII secretion target [Streptomyces sparsus]